MRSRGPQFTVDFRVGTFGMQGDQALVFTVRGLPVGERVVRIVTPVEPRDDHVAGVRIGRDGRQQGVAPLHGIAAEPQRFRPRPAEV